MFIHTKSADFLDMRRATLDNFHCKSLVTQLRWWDNAETLITSIVPLVIKRQATRRAKLKTNSAGKKRRRKKKTAQLSYSEFDHDKRDKNHMVVPIKLLISIEYLHIFVLIYHNVTLLYFTCRLDSQVQRKYKANFSVMTHSHGRLYTKFRSSMHDKKNKIAGYKLFVFPLSDNNSHL